MAKGNKKNKKGKATAVTHVHEKTEEIVTQEIVKSETDEAPVNPLIDIDLKDVSLKTGERYILQTNLAIIEKLDQILKELIK